jgi:hypothetical protein
MPPDSEYHTVLPAYGPREQNVYHNHNDCYEGRRIKQEHRTPGRGTAPLVPTGPLAPRRGPRPLCDICAGMN